MHTPGPYRQGKTSDSIVSDSREGLHPHFSADDMEYYGGYVIAESVASCNIPLLIAAPELLEVCKYISEAWDSGIPIGGPHVRVAKAAIAKAEGKS